jgi:hypothetical protein
VIVRILIVVALSPVRLPLIADALGARNKKVVESVLAEIMMAMLVTMRVIICMCSTHTGAVLLRQDQEEAASVGLPHHKMSFEHIGSTPDAAIVAVEGSNVSESTRVY